MQTGGDGVARSCDPPDGGLEREPGNLAAPLEGLTAPYFNVRRGRGGLGRLARGLVNVPLHVVGRPQRYFNDAVRAVIRSCSELLRARIEEELRLGVRLAEVEARVKELEDRRSCHDRVTPEGAVEAVLQQAGGTPAPVATDWNLRVHPGRFRAVYTAPAHMTAQERVALYALVFGTEPKRCLEIGTLRGGSTVIICAALDDIGNGRIACVDPNPQVTDEVWGQVSHRAVMLRGPSPDVLPEATQVVGGPFDFAFIDGDHEREGVIRDIEGVLPLLATNAHLMFHDAHYFEVREAIDEMLLKHGDCLVDCGMVAVGETPEAATVRGHPVVWGGLRLLRHVRQPLPASQEP